MTRKCFAAIKSGQETMSEIEQLAEGVMHKPTSAYAAMKQILAIAGKWNKDFQGVDPAWQPNQKEQPAQPQVRQQAIAAGAFIQGARA